MSNRLVKPALPVPVENPQEYEDEHVHAVYENIASHFSATRYKPWPIIARFLADIPPGWVGLDSGTGNGKYLPLSPQAYTIGLDRSRNLLDIARATGGEVVCGDVLGCPWRTGVFDYAISIATIHHLATRERRMLAVKRLVQAVSPERGRIVIYVWAIEQDTLSKRSVPDDDVGQGHDAFVPWVSATQQFDRYYHFFAKGELRALVEETIRELGLQSGPPRTGAGVEVVQDGWERSNYYVELRRWTQ